MNTDKTNKIIITLSLDKKLVEVIDKKKGLTKRSTFIEDLLKKSLGIKDDR
jgi:metal-responsive CopG/Arc/MetJ family transcriptional regulator